MALTKKQELQLFEILEVPFTNDLHRLVGGNLIVESQDISTSPASAFQQIQDFLAAEVFTDPEKEDYLVELITRWDELGTCVTVITDGTIGSLTGVNDDINRERQEIRRKVIIIVPFYQFHKDYQRKRQSIAMRF